LAAWVCAVWVMEAAMPRVQSRFLDPTAEIQNY